MRALFASSFLGSVVPARCQHDYNVIPPGREPGCFGIDSIGCPEPMYPAIACRRNGAGVPCEDVNILINNPESGGWPGGGPMKYVTYAMLRRINEAQALLPGYYVKITYQDDGCNGDNSQRLLVSQLVEHPNLYVAFGGTSCSSTAMTTSTITPLFRLPHVAWAASSPDLSDRTRYQNFFRTRVADTGSNMVWLTLAVHVGWTKVGIVFGETSRFAFHHSLLLADIEAARARSNNPIPIEVLWDTQVVLLEHDTRTVISYVKTFGSRVLIVLSYEKVLRAIMCHGLREGVKGLLMMSLGWHSASFPQDRTEPDMSGAGDSAFTCAAEEMNDLFLSSVIGTNGDLWSSAPLEPISCVPGMTSAGLRAWFEDVGLNGSGYEADGVIYVDQISAGMDGMCTVLFMLQEMLITRGRTLEQLQTRSLDIYDEIVDVLSATSFVGVSSRHIGFRNGDLDGGVSILQTGRLSPEEPVTFIPIGKYEQGNISFIHGDIHWPDGSSGFADAPSDLFPACTEGSILVLGECVPCAPGTKASASEGGYRQCVPCPAGEYGNESGLTTCAACPTGHKSMDNPLERTACEPCGEGSFADAVGSHACSSCVPGRYANATAQTACARCSRGSYSNRSASVCALCHEGYFADSDAAEICLPCPRGYFAAGNGSTACARCGLGEYSSTGGGRLCDGCPSPFTTQFPGAVDAVECTCPEATYHADGICTPCPEGMECGAGSDMEYLRAGTMAPESPCPSGVTCTHPMLRLGFWSSEAEPLSVFRCHNPLRCPGGTPGTCATGREGRTCSECEDGYTPSSGGECKPCEGSDVGPFAIGIAALVLGLAILYHVVRRVDRTKAAQSTIFVGLACGTFITVLQQLGVVSTLEIEWREPIKAVLAFMMLFNFDIEVLRLNCVAMFSPTVTYLFKLLMIAFILVVIVVIHIVYTLLTDGFNFKKNRSNLMGAVGAIFMVFFISVVSSVVAPFECSGNPNGKRTVSRYPSVICGDSGDHLSMILIAFVFLLVPLGFLSLTAYAVRQYPRRMQRLDTDFLRSFNFLFFRFHSTTYWYCLAFLVRNLLFALVPVLPNPVVQLLVCQVILIGSLSLSIHFMPWRAQPGNVLDIGITFGMITFVLCSAFFVQDADLGALSSLCAAFVVFSLVLILAAILYGVSVRFLRTTRPYQYFLCHHKAGAGCFARLLKLVLAGARGVRKKIFIDSDNLKDLDKLFDTVGSEVDTLVALCSKDLLSRPWCMGELVTARANKVHVVCMLFPEFEFPTQEYMDDYTSLVSDIGCITERGIGLPMIQDTLEWLKECPTVSLPERLDMGAVQLVVGRLVGRHYDGEGSAPGGEASPTPAARTGTIALVVDHSDWEAVATVNILHKLLLPHFAHNMEAGPFVLSEETPLPADASVIVLICTPGIFHQLNALRALAGASQRLAFCMPIIASGSFRIPTEASLQDITHVLTSSDDDPHHVIGVITDVFKSIAVVFDPGQYNSTEVILRTTAEGIANRLLGRVSLRKMSTPATSFVARPGKQTQPGRKKLTL